MSNSIQEQHQANQKALQEFQKVWDSLPQKDKREKRLEWAERLEHALPHTSMALRNDLSNDEIDEAVRKDGFAEKIQYINAVQEQASLILQLLLEKGDSVSYVNMGDVWKPNKEDFARAFTMDVDEAFEAYQNLWKTTPVAFPNDGQDQIIIQASTPDLISEARLFPNGFEQCVHRFHPDTVWICWKYVADGSSKGMAYNGLVWLGDRFKWFPKPWRMWNG